MSQVNKFHSTFEYKLIYIFRINQDSHLGSLKIGEATVNTNKNHLSLHPNSRELNVAAKSRIDSYTSTAGIIYELLHTEIAVYTKNGKLKAFKDYKVHNVLTRSGIKKKYFGTNKRQNEWFQTDLQTAILAIKAVKSGKPSLHSSEITDIRSPIIFRPEQMDAINKTIKRFKKDTSMLWNAKMRFGKTLSALQVVKKMEFNKTIIITHRPAVSDGWFEDFHKIFYDRPDYHFGSKDKGMKIKDALARNNNIIYFASLQDLRGSEKVGGTHDKNLDVFKMNWDFIIIDEAHEGTQTGLAQAVMKELVKEQEEHITYVLQLSGTPFNLISEFEPESIYTWDYIMEQEAKTFWNQETFGDSNPYDGLPRMNIYTYHLEKSLPVYLDVEDKAFNFREFFRLWTGDIKKDFERIPAGFKIGDFVHQNDINAFLDLICTSDSKTNYPFSTEEYRDFFKHSLWMIPGVREAKALSSLLRKHPVFKNFKIINVAGDGDEEIDTSKALEAVRKGMTSNPEDTYTITLSCGRLTTGVSIPEWTAVLMLAGTYSTSASQYLQTIFRVQTPANINGKIKRECYVFDFAPDRTLKMIASSVQLSARAGEKNPIAEVSLRKFLNYCPVIAIQDSVMRQFKVSDLLQELKKAYAERVARNGFDDPKIYNDDLLNLTNVELEQFAKLQKIVGKSKQTVRSRDIEINRQGFDEEETERERELETRRRKKELTEEEKKLLEELKKQKKNRATAISILRAISIRMPLLVYGMDRDILEDITIDNFADLIDESSWVEFMPPGVTKEHFNQFSKYYDKDIFIAASRRIRYLSKTADELEPIERIKKIAELFATFRNPDKETVLTPWRVVNKHLGETIGGSVFYDENYEYLIEKPRYREIDGVTNNIFNQQSKILEINSKTGLYPLYMAYSLYEKDINALENQDITAEQKEKMWLDIVTNKIFIICKTPMAKQITKRTLLGYKEGKINMHAFDNIVMQLSDKSGKFVRKVTTKRFWNIGGNEEMKFNAIVGNPPYQLKVSGNENQQNAINIYHLFYQAALKIKPDYVSLIMPSRWMTGGRGLDEFRQETLEKNNFLLMHDHINAREIFSTVEIKGGICYFLSKPDYNGKCNYYFHYDGETHHNFRMLDRFNIGMVVRDYRAIKIIEKVVESEDFTSFERIAGSQTPFGIITSFTDYTSSPTRENTMKIYGNKFIGYTSPTNILKNHELAYKHKVYVPKAVGSGVISSDRIKPIVADNPSICTQTYIVYGEFETRNEAVNLSHYMKTKFFHFLLGQLKNTQQMSPSMFKLVPLLDFNRKWTDNDLYDKYNFTREEREFIDLVVDPK
ncbi:MAG TPA: Eco57I restriction-modification methylase domain-containing protein [Bacilli bacterium]|nr:Eco57I restriction-modification methylase domain-containing protein [Bacilli bacterium]